MPRLLPILKDNTGDLSILREFSRIKLIALDLDGTLLEGAGTKIPKKVVKLGRQLANWHYGDTKLTIASGRTFYGVRDILDSMQMIRKDTPLVLYNGGVTTYKNLNVIDKKVIPEKSFKEILSVLSGKRVKLIAYSLQQLSVEGAEEYAIGWSSLDRPKLEHNGMEVNWNDWGHFDIYHLPSTIVIHVDNINLKTHDVLDCLCNIEGITCSIGSSYVEVKPKGVDKGVALQNVCMSLSISNDRVLSIGDNDNDAEMLKWSGIGVAVKSASTLAKKNSTYIAGRGVLEGAIEVLNLIVQANHLLAQVAPSRRNISAGLIKHNLEIVHDKQDLYDEGSVATIFVEMDRISDYVSSILNKVINEKNLEYAIRLGLLPIFTSDGIHYALVKDILLILPTLTIQSKSETERFKINNLFFSDEFWLNESTYIELPYQDSEVSPLLVAGLRNLINIEPEPDHKLLTEFTSLTYFNGSRINSKSNKILQYATKQLLRAENTDLTQLSKFAHSAQYMGNKKKLAGFIIENVSSIIPDTATVIDVMCGSGAMSAAFNKIWHTCASDALSFCRNLALVQGGGFTRNHAKDILNSMRSHIKSNYDNLVKSTYDWVELENDLFHKEIDHKLVNEYRRLINDYPTFANNKKDGHWHPSSEIIKRQNDSTLYPFCLFTCYFANIYFGLRQAIEIDSIRYAINNLQSDNDRRWALGTLTASVSALGTTYGGHFAQPRVKSASSITVRNIGDVVSKRSLSVVNEFTVRLMDLAENSEKTNRTIKIAGGPWQTTFDELEKSLTGSEVLVYLDPPYRREDYSRYYHVLETLANYDYPSCNGIGLTPLPKERFTSRFNTHVKAKIIDEISKVILGGLAKGWVVVWSYSDSAAVNVMDVIEGVKNNRNCIIKSYATSNYHQSHGGAKRKKVVEYLICFKPIS